MNLDWRQRPIPGEMLLYARQDTHYLLYIYDRLRLLPNSLEVKLLTRYHRNAALQKGTSGQNLLRSIWDRSKNLCLQLYEKPVVMPDDGIKLMRKSNLQLEDSQLRALQVLFLYHLTIPSVFRKFCSSGFRAYWCGATL